MANLTDDEVVAFWEEFSDLRDASFLGPDEDLVREFRVWLGAEKDVVNLDSWSQQLITEYRRQELND